MRRLTALLTVTVALAVLAAVPIAALAAPGSGPPAQPADEPRNQTAEVAPGEQLGGVIGVGEAELESEVDSRAFGIQVARAASDEARADIVGEKLGDLEQRLDTLEERKAALLAARANGSVSDGRYKAEIARVAAEVGGVDRMTNRSARAAGALPTDLLERTGINASAIETLQNRAEDVAGPEVAEIARSIAGNAAGTAPGEAAGPAGTPAGPPGDIPRGQPGADGNATAEETPTIPESASETDDTRTDPTNASGSEQ